MASQEQINRICEITERFFAPLRGGGLGAALLAKSPPFDLEQPNIHDSKAEFLLERDHVEKSAMQAITLGRMLGKADGDSAEREAMIERVNGFVNESARAEMEGEFPETVILMLRKNAANFDLIWTVRWLLLDLYTQLKQRKRELDQQEKEFWSGAHRAPHHYARTIALRFAQKLAAQTGKKPTFGVAREGNHPSTDFRRALQEIFEVLEITADFRRAGKWAIDQLSDEDLQQPANALAQYLDEFMNKIPPQTSRPNPIFSENPAKAYRE